MSTRRERGLTQSIYLVKLDITDAKLVFHVLGTSQRVYKVTCAKELSPKCTCPDHCTRKSTCKHIYFVCERVMNLTPSKWSEVEDISTMADIVLQRLPHLHVSAGDYYVKKYEELLKNQKAPFVKKSEKHEEETVPQVAIRN